MSTLNPEAEEFRPFEESDLESWVEEVYANMKEATRSCNTFPIGESYNQFQTYTEFNGVISQLRNKVVFLSNRIIKSEGSTTLKCDEDDESSQERVAEFLDALVDRVSGPVGGAPAPSTAGPSTAGPSTAGPSTAGLSTAGPSTAGSSTAGPSTAGPSKAGPSVAAWNRKPTLADVLEKAGGKEIPRPQLAFREPVDNSDKLFVPRISDKPNAMRPLALTLRLGPDGRPAGYEHPYQLELATWVPPQWALGGGYDQPEAAAQALGGGDDQPEEAARALGGGDEQPEAAARALGGEDEQPEAAAPRRERSPYVNDVREMLLFRETRLTMVETGPALAALLVHLDTVREIAVDLEHHSYRTYQGMTCLIQLSTDDGGDFIIDALALRDHLHLLNHAFTHPDKIKVFHGADQDVLWLQRDFGVYVVGLFDTHQAARALRLPQASLKYLLEYYCGVHVDKMYQLADWRQRPVPSEMIRYARTDTHYLLSVWRHMRAELTPQALLDVFRASQRVAGTTYNKPVLTADAHLVPYVRSGKRWGTAQLLALRALYAWRDAHARVLDDAPSYLLPTHKMMAVCEALPRDVQGLRALLQPLPPLALNHLHDMHQIILACHCVTEALPSIARTRPFHDLLAVPDTSVSQCTAEASTRDARPCEPDVPALRATTHAHQRSQLNAAAASFLPPFHRYRVYRLSAQAEEEAALLATRARAEGVGRGSEAVRAAVLQPLNANDDVQEEPAANAQAMPPVHEYHTPPPSPLVHAPPPAPRKRKLRAEAAGEPYAPEHYNRLRTARTPPKPRKHRKAE